MAETAARELQEARREAAEAWQVRKKRAAERREAAARHKLRLDKVREERRAEKEQEKAAQDAATAEWVRAAARVKSLESA
jgi:hypothetical protein